MGGIVCGFCQRVRILYKNSFLLSDLSQIPLYNSLPRKRGTPGQWLYRVTVQEKMMNLPGILFLAANAVLIALGIGGHSVMLGVSFFIISLPFLYAVIVIPSFGIFALLVASYLIFGIIRIGFNFPVGTLMDGIEWMLLIGLLVKPKLPGTWSLSKDSVGMLALLWVFYNIIEVLNPSAASYDAWLYTIRSVGIVVLMYFVFRYHIRSVQLVRFLLYTWLALAFLAALYAFKQEYIGFSVKEAQYIHDNPDVVELLFIDGHWRKFSFLSDPVAFSYNMVISSILAVCMTGSTKKFWLKILFLSLCIFYLWAMTFSGTRGAYVLIPAALVLYTVLNFNKYAFVISLVVGIALAVLIFMPTSNYTLFRFQSAFRPAQDASFLVRQKNQAKIKPYILTHPMGGGLGATGVWGQRFAPDSYLAKFPPDSGYVRVAVEMGWIGLFLFCCLMFAILRSSILNYFRIRNKELKSYCLAMTLILFVMNIGNFPQEALVQFPNSVYFYLVAALSGVTLQLDQQQNKKENNA